MSCLYLIIKGFSLSSAWLSTTSWTMFLSITICEREPPKQLVMCVLFLESAGFYSVTTLSLCFFLSLRRVAGGSP